MNMTEIVYIVAFIAFLIILYLIFSSDSVTSYMKTVEAAKMAETNASTAETKAQMMDNINDLCTQYADEKVKSAWLSTGLNRTAYFDDCVKNSYWVT